MSGDLPVWSLQNFRDVGGRLAGSGTRVRDGILCRSDAPRLGDPPPPGVPWPPAILIDLRSRAELVGEP
jgi:protein-tyrosine phosphatase